MTNPDAEQTGTSAQMLNESLNYFQTKEIDPGDGWAFPDDYSSLCLDFRGTDDTAFWLDLERNGTIRVVWRPNGAKLRSMTFVAASQDAREELEPYCQHLQICSSRDPLFNNPCDCGLEAALAAPQSAPALSPSQQAERLPSSDAAKAGADAVALAKEALGLFLRHLRGNSQVLLNGYEINITCEDYEKIFDAHAALAAPQPQASAADAALADEFEGMAKAHRAMGEKQEADNYIRAAEALRSVPEQPQAGTGEPVTDPARQLISRPYIGAWTDEVIVEAAHQRDRWGADQDHGKQPEDWFWLIGYLAGKSLASHKAGDMHKARHHTVSTAAVLAHWAAAINGDESVFRPGLGIEKLASIVATPSPTAAESLANPSK